MIYVQRMPADLGFVMTNGFPGRIAEETVKAKAWFTGPNAGKTFEFNCYKNPFIKEKLKEIFKGKCAYCDSTLVHISAGDVEHFRPKSVYWWLACDWNNLLFACEKCNRTGKNDRFPLWRRNETSCKDDDPQTLVDEDVKVKLLVNPCREDPEEFFQYDEATASICPASKNPKNSYRREMAEMSISVYTLQRRELVQEREKVMILLLAQIGSVKKMMESLNHLSGFTSTIRKQFEDRLKDELKKLLLFNQPERSYLGMVRQVLRKFFTENGIALPDSLKQ